MKSLEELRDLTKEELLIEYKKTKQEGQKILAEIEQLKKEQSKNL